MKTALVLIAAVFLAGCATRAVRTSEASEVPASRVVSHPNVSSNTPAKVIVVRDIGAMGSANTIHFKIDGRDVALFNQAEMTKIVLDPGEYTFSVNDWLNHHYETRVVLKNNDKAHYRISYGDSGILVQRWEELAD